MNKITYTIILTFAVFIDICFAQLSVEVSNEARRIQNLNIAEVTTNALEADDREAVLKELRKRRAINRLIRLKDEKTIDALFRDFREAKGKIWSSRRLLERSSAPWLLEELGPFLHEDEIHRRDWVVGGDLRSDFGYSMTCAQLMVKIIASSPEVSAEARAAAAAIRGAGVYDGLNTRLLDMMRRWWKVNKDTVQEERYHDLTPPTINWATPPAEGVKQEPRPDEDFDSLVASKGEAKVASDSVAVSADAPRWMIISLVGLVVVVILTFGLARHRRRG